MSLDPGARGCCVSVYLKGEVLDHSNISIVLLLNLVHRPLNTKEIVEPHYNSLNCGDEFNMNSVCLGPAQGDLVIVTQLTHYLGELEYLVILKLMNLLGAMLLYFFLF